MAFSSGNTQAVLLAFACISILQSAVTAQQDNKSAASRCTVVGAMKQVMWEGQLYGTIDLDTIPNKHHLFGLGPAEYLAGELVIIDGRSYKSTVLTDSTMTVEETYHAKAPFFVYANIIDWKAHTLPDSIGTTRQLESYLDQTTKTIARPFAFRLNGIVETATIHIVNLPIGSDVHSPEDARRGLREYHLKNTTVDIVGFFSTAHKAVFTHHDSFVHMHLITSDKKSMGHLQEAQFEQGSMTLAVPNE